MDQLIESLRQFPSQKKVAMKLLEYGIRVDDKGVAYCGDIEQTDSGIARACDVDRRVVRTTLEKIAATPELFRIFSKLKPMLSMIDLADEINCSSLIIIPTDATIPGILADVTSVLFNSGVTLRQAMIHDDGQHMQAKLELVVNGKIQENVIMMLKSCKGVASIVIKC